MDFNKLNTAQKATLLIGLTIGLILLFIAVKYSHEIRQKQIWGDSSYYPVEYSTYPRLTGNDVADTVLLRGYQ